MLGAPLKFCNEIPEDEIVTFTALESFRCEDKEDYDYEI